MSKITACIDGSDYTEAVCTMAAWAAKRMGLPVTLLHTVPDHRSATSAVDYSGQIGLGAKSDLLQQLADLDEQHGKLVQKRGQLVLEHASQTLASKQIEHITLHQRGDFIALADEQAAETDLFIAGKRGDKGCDARGILGSHIEGLARALEKPVLITPHAPRAIERILVAYDGSESSEKALDFAIESNLFKGLECHIVIVDKVAELGAKKREAAEAKLADDSFSAVIEVIDSASVDESVTAYIEKHNIDMLLMGAYGHSAIRRFFLGSTTSAQIAKTKVPVLLFR